MTALIPLSVLGVGGVGWIPLALVYTPVPPGVSYLASVSATVATVSVTLISSVITQSFTVTPQTAVSVASVSTPLL